MRPPIKLERRTKHGLARSYTYRGWQRLRTQQASLYGPWSDYLVFLRDVGKRPPKASIVRLDEDRPYEPGNVRWAVFNRKTKEWE